MSRRERLVWLVVAACLGVVVVGVQLGAQTQSLNPLNQPTAAAGGGGTPGGSDTQVQYNDGGAFGGDAGLVYNETTDALTLAGPLSTGKVTVLDGVDGIWFGTVATAPKLLRSGADLLIRANDDSFYSIVHGGQYTQHDGNPSQLRGIQVMNTFQIAFSDGVDFNRGLTAGAGAVVKFTDGASGGGTIQVGDAGTKPTCDAAARGMHWLDAGGAGVADTYEVCGKAAADTYSWVALATF